MLVRNERGHYAFLKGIAPYSSGTVALDGYEIVHVVLRQALPWRDGFERIRTYLGDVGCDRYALCGVELRCPEPYSMAGFIGFNRSYCAVLEDWGLLVDGVNPVARTNVSPVLNSPEAPVLYGFSHTAPVLEPMGATFVAAGAGELASRDLVSEGIVRRGDTSADAMREKGTYVMDVMEKRLTGLGSTWDDVTTVDVYTAHPVGDILQQVVLPRLGAAAHHGVRWYHTRPPIVEIEYEMDLRGVRKERILS